jgi:hypothetical protein
MKLWLAIAAAMLAPSLCAAAPAPIAPIAIELNRLDDHAKDCRASFVVANPGPDSFVGFKLDLVIFDRGGTIEKRLAADVAPLPAAKTAVKIFDIPDLSCTAIGSILVNDVLDCRTAGGPVADCVGRVAVSSKLAVKLIK